MRAIEITRFGEPEVLKETSRPEPQAGPGEVLVRVTASGVNRPDVLQRKGLYPMPPGVSDLPGLEIAGTIVAGDDAELAAAGFALGDAGLRTRRGGRLRRVVRGADRPVPAVPAGFSDVEAASLPETFFTVWQNVFEIARLQPGEALLVQGGTSGIGVTAIQLAKALGARVLATAGSDEKCAGVPVARGGWRRSTTALRISSPKRAV